MYQKQVASSANFAVSDLASSAPAEVLPRDCFSDTLSEAAARHELPTLEQARDEASRILKLLAVIM